MWRPPPPRVPYSGRVSTNQPGDDRRPNSRTDADQAIDPSTSPAVLASLAEDRAAVRHLVAANPSAPVHILMWLHELRDPAIERALSSNPTATSANVVRPTMAPPLPAPRPEAIVPTTASGLAAATAATASVPITPSGSTGRTEPTPRIDPVVVGAAAAAGVAGAAAAGAGAAAGVTRTHEHPGRGWASWAILLVPLLAILGIGALVALVRSTGTSDRRSVTAAASTTLPTLAPSAAPSTQPTLAPSTAAVVTAPPATDAPTTQDAAAAGAASAASEAPETTASRPVTTARRPTTTVRPATTVAPTTPTTARATASVAPTAAPPPTVLAASVVPTTSATPTPASASAVAAATSLAQRLATALASSDWATARKINPAGALSDAKYGADYGTLTDSNVVPIATTATGKSTYSMRLGLVAHETTPAGVRSTTLFCVHWNADTAASTIVQVDGSKVRTAPGRVEASAVTSELKKACAAANLK